MLIHLLSLFVRKHARVQRNTRARILQAERDAWVRSWHQRCDEERRLNLLRRRAS
jgi:hypothetical protein